MDGLARPARSRRLRFCGARLATLLCTAIAALASCQPFRDDNAGFDAPATDFADYDACITRGGQWLRHAHRCREMIVGDAEPPGLAPP